MRWWRSLVVLGLLGAVLAVADSLAREAAEAELERRLTAQVPGAAGVDAEIEAFAFLPRLALTGRIPAVRARVATLAAGPLRLADADVSLRGVRLDRRALLRRREVQLRAVDSGTASVVLDEAAVSAALGLPVEIDASGRVRVSFRGRTVTAPVAVADDGRIVVDLPGPLPALPLTAGALPLLPCTPRAVPEPGRVRLSCAVTQVPPELLREANRRT